MKITRHHVFETNSSSSHSITFPSIKRDPKYWNTFFSSSELCISGEGEYGWGYERYSNIANKLDYLMLDIESCISDSDKKKFYYDKIHRVFAEYNCGTCKLNLNNSNVTGYIDLQSVGNGVDILEKPDEILAQYMFDESVELIIDNDNH